MDSIQHSLSFSDLNSESLPGSWKLLREGPVMTTSPLKRHCIKHVASASRAPPNLLRLACRWIPEKAFPLQTPWGSFMVLSWAPKETCCEILTKKDQKGMSCDCRNGCTPESGSTTSEVLRLERGAFVKERSIKSCGWNVHSFSNQQQESNMYARVRKHQNIQLIKKWIAWKAARLIPTWTFPLRLVCWYLSTACSSFSVSTSHGW